MNPAIEITLRVLHVLSAIGLLGGTMFVVVGMLPALKARLEDDEQRAELASAAVRKYYKITHASILLLLATGVAQWVMLHDVYEQGNKALIASMLGTKVLIALGIFTIIFAQAFGVLKGPPGRWAKVGMVMGVLVVILAGVVRTLRLDALGG